MRAVFHLCHCTEKYEMKIGSINNEMGRHYVQTWIKAMQVFLGWSKQQTIHWAEKWKESLNDPDEMFYNETPTWYITTLLIPESIRTGLSGVDKILVRRILLGLIQNDDSFFDQK